MYTDKEDKNMKRIVSFLMAFFLLASCAVPAFAAGSDVTYYVSQEEQDIFLGQTYKRKITAKPSGADTSIAVWTSSNPSVAPVNAKTGVITGKKKGSATIMVEIGEETFLFKVTVVNPYLSEKTKSVYLGQKFTLKVIGGNGTVKWKSSNSKIASVSKSGVVTTKKAGKATVTATRNGVQMKCTVTVKKPTLKTTSLILQRGDKAALKLNGGSGTVKWKSADTKIASVSKKGVVTAKKLGKTTITATVNGYTLKCKVAIYAHSLNKTKLKLESGNSYRLIMSGGSGTTKFSTSNPKVAYVNKSGIVTGKNKGTATITAQKNGVKMTCKVTVTVTPIAVPEGKKAIIASYNKAINKVKDTKYFSFVTKKNPDFLVKYSEGTKAGVFASLIRTLMFTSSTKSYAVENNTAYLIKNGTKAKSGTSVSALIPPYYKQCAIPSAGVKKATATQVGSGCLITLTLVKEKSVFSESTSKATVYNKMVSTPFDISLIYKFVDDGMPTITTTYPGTVVKALIDKRGRLVSLDVTAEQTMSLICIPTGIDAITEQPSSYEAEITDKISYTFDY